MSMPTENRRLSITRLVFVVSLVGCLLFFAAKYITQSVVDLYLYAKGDSPTWVAPYVDVALKPMIYFESDFGSQVKNVVIGSIVASPLDPTKPTWGSYYDLDAAARALDLDRRLVRFQEQGGAIIVSFGGDLSNEMASVNISDAELALAYQNVINRYQIYRLDFNLLDSVLTDLAATERRVSALNTLQRDNPDIEIWLSMPVSSSGLTSGGINMIESALRDDIKLAGINLIVKDYGEAELVEHPLSDVIHQSILAAKDQLELIYLNAEQPKTDYELWRLIGVTPMIGRNEFTGEIFDSEAADLMVDFLQDKNIGRLSMLTINRDQSCGINDAIKPVSGTCSGVEQYKNQFANLFIKAFPAHIDGPERSEQQTLRLQSLKMADLSSGLMDGKINHNPFPSWHQQVHYDETDKVVWQGRVYKAKWSTKGDQPDEAVAFPWDSPWLYLGPVLKSDRESVESVAVTSGRRTQWKNEQVFLADDEVLHNNVIYRARWWTQGVIPERSPDRAFDHPWEYLGTANCENRSCMHSGIAANLLVNYGGLKDVKLEIRLHEPDRTAGSGKIIQTHVSQSGQKTYQLLQDSYDLILSVGASELVLENIDCSGRACSAGEITSTLTVDYRSLTNVTMELHHADGIEGMTGEMLNVYAAQSGQKTYTVLRNSYDIIFKSGSSSFVVDTVDCNNLNCNPGEIAATLVVDFQNLEGIVMEVRVADGRSQSSGAMVQLHASQSGTKTYAVLLGKYDLIFKKGASTYIANDIDCRFVSCEAGNIVSELVIDFGDIAATVEVRKDDGAKGSSGALVDLYVNQSGMQRFGLLKGQYDISIKDDNWNLVEDAVNCTGKKCDTDVGFRLMGVTLSRLEADLEMLGKRYMPKHPEYIALRERIEEIRRTQQAIVN